MANYKPIFKTKRKYYIKEFSFLWWLIGGLKGAAIVGAFYMFYICMWVLCG